MKLLILNNCISHGDTEKTKNIYGIFLRKFPRKNIYIWIQQYYFGRNKNNYGNAFIPSKIHWKIGLMSNLICRLNPKTLQLKSCLNFVPSYSLFYYSLNFNRHTNAACGCRNWDDSTAPGTHLRICYYLEKAGPCKRVGSSLPIDYPQSKIQQTKMLVTCQRFGALFLFGLIWQYSSNHKTLGWQQLHLALIYGYSTI